MTRENSVGVIIARFQVPRLHTGHMYLLNYVYERHEDVMVMLGMAPFSKRDPLDFMVRYHMIRAVYPKVKVVGLQDIPGDNKMWSAQVDSLIIHNVRVNCPVVLYGSRDSFIPHYSGGYPVHEIPPLEGVESGTEIRESMKAPKGESEDFRWGMIYASRLLKDRG